MREPYTTDLSGLKLPYRPFMAAPESGGFNCRSEWVYVPTETTAIDHEIKSIEYNEETMKNDKISKDTFPGIAAPKADPAGFKRLSLLDILDSQTERMTAEYIGKARMLLTQRFGPVEDELWDTLVDDLRRRGWSSGRLMYITSQVIKKPFKTWNPGDFTDNTDADILLYNHEWLSLEVSKNRKAMDGMRGYEIPGYTGIWYRYDDGRRMPSNLTLRWDRGKYIKADPEQMLAAGTVTIGSGTIEQNGDALEVRQPTLVQSLSDQIASSIRAAADEMRLKAEITALQQERDQIQTRLDIQYARNQALRAALTDADLPLPDMPEELTQEEAKPAKSEETPEMLNGEALSILWSIGVEIANGCEVVMQETTRGMFNDPLVYIRRGLPMPLVMRLREVLQKHGRDPFTQVAPFIETGPSGEFIHKVGPKLTITPVDIMKRRTIAELEAEAAEIERIAKARKSRKPRGRL